MASTADQALSKYAAIRDFSRSKSRKIPDQESLRRVMGIETPRGRIGSSRTSNRFNSSSSIERSQTAPFSRTESRTMPLYIPVKARGNAAQEATHTRSSSTSMDESTLAKPMGYASDDSESETPFDPDEKRVHRIERSITSQHDMQSQSVGWRLPEPIDKQNSSGKTHTSLEPEYLTETDLLARHTHIQTNPRKSTDDTEKDNPSLPFSFEGHNEITSRKLGYQSHSGLSMPNKKKRKHSSEIPFSSSKKRLQDARELSQQYLMNSQQIWLKLSNHPRFKDGTIDIDELCSGLQAKALCPEEGQVVNEEDVDALLKRLDAANDSVPLSPAGIAFGPPLSLQKLNARILKMQGRLPERMRRMPPAPDLDRSNMPSWTLADWDAPDHLLERSNSHHPFLDNSGQYKVDSSDRPLETLDHQAIPSPWRFLARDHIPQMTYNVLTNMERNPKNRPHKASHLKRFGQIDTKKQEKRSNTTMSYTISQDCTVNDDTRRRARFCALEDRKSAHVIKKDRTSPKVGLRDRMLASMEQDVQQNVDQRVQQKIQNNIQQSFSKMGK